MIKTADLTPRQRKIALTLIACMVSYTLFGFVGAPFIVRSILEKQVAAAIHRPVTVGPVRVNPLTLSITLRDLTIREPGGGPFVKLDEAYVNLQTASLFKWAVVLKSVRLVNPDILLVRTPEGTFNFSDIGTGDAPEAPEDSQPANAGGGALAVYDTRITGGRIVVDDRVVSVTHHIEDLNLSLTDLSSRPADVKVYTLFKLAARVNDAAFSLDGKTRPFGPQRETKAELGLNALRVPHYLPYLPLPENLVVRSLQVEAQTEINFRVGQDNQPELVVAGLLSLRDLQLADGSGDPLVNHRELTFDLLPSTVLDRADSAGPGGSLRSGNLSETAAFRETCICRFWRLKAYDTGPQAAAAEDTTGRFQPVVTIDRLNLKQGVVHFTDLANSEPFSTTITDLNLEVDNFGLNSDRTAAYRLALKTEADESVSLSGTASLAPLQVSGEIEVVGCPGFPVRSLLSRTGSTSRPWTAVFPSAAATAFSQEDDAPHWSPWPASISMWMRSRWWTRMTTTP